MLSAQRIVPNLWFDTQAEEAAKFYTSVFKNSKIGRVVKYTKEGFETHKKPEGSVMTVEFELEGQKFIAINGGPDFKFNEAVSLAIQCETQKEIDYYWDKLTPGGDPKSQVCGWLKDRFGLSWQVTPTILDDMLADKDREKAGRVMNAMMPMKKINIEELKQAFAGKRELSMSEEL